MSEPADYTPRDWAAHPPYLTPEYKSTRLRAPKQRLLPLPQTLSELTGPLFGHDDMQPGDDDLTHVAGATAEAVGERIVVSGRVLDEAGRPVPNTLVEVWQCNAAGRYNHERDQHDAPLDPNFQGTGRCVTDEQGNYSYVSIRPGAYPWPNHQNAWRPPHIHLSLFGPSFLTRLVTQMYFQGDPLLPLDPIFNGVPAASRDLLVARYDHELTRPDFALGWRFDIVLRGRDATPMEN
ncbi:MAG: protocatechuate 3,4-dioxygenase subunit beta [Alphaproteobacteria bacterium]